MTGLKAFQSLDRDKFEDDGVKLNWLKMADGETAKIRFINELDEDSPNYDPARGLALVVSEHSNPKAYVKKAECSMADEGRCWACEYNQAHPKQKWHAKYRFYINVYVDNGRDDPFVAVWSQGTQKQSAFTFLREFAIDKGSISNRTWKIKRQGEGTDTVYSLIPDDPDSDKFDWKGLEPYNLDRAVRKVPYDQQEAFYLGFEQIGSSDATVTEIKW